MATLTSTKCQLLENSSGRIVFRNSYGQIRQLVARRLDPQGMYLVLILCDQNGKEIDSEHRQGLYGFSEFSSWLVAIGGVTRYFAAKIKLNVANGDIIAQVPNRVIGLDAISTHPYKRSA